VSQIESLSQLEEKLNNLSLTAKNNIDKELLDPQNISPELREEVDSFEDEMIENQNTIIGYDKSSIDKPKENSSE